MTLTAAYSHAPAGYECPFCRIVAGLDCEADWSKQSDVVYRDETVTAFVNAAFWPNNVGSVIVVPNAHYESVYTIPGLGRLTVDAVLARDYPVIQAVILLFSLVYVLINLLVDIIYTLLDPRIRY